MPQSIKPTQTELKNSWDEASLTAYVRERNQVAMARILGDDKKRDLTVENCGRSFNPHRWGK